MADGNVGTPAGSAPLKLTVEELRNRATEANLRVTEAAAVLYLLAESIAERVDENDLPGGYMATCLAIRTAEEAGMLMMQMADDLYKVKEVSCG